MVRQGGHFVARMQPESTYINRLAKTECLEKPSKVRGLAYPCNNAEARYRTRSGTSWVGYLVHLAETCEDDAVDLITHAMTTVATVHEARCTAAIHEALAGKGLTWWTRPTSTPSCWC